MINSINLILAYLQEKGMYNLEHVPGFKKVYKTIIEMYTNKSRHNKTQSRIDKILNIQKINNEYIVIGNDNKNKNSVKKFLLSIDDDRLLGLLKDYEYTCKRNLCYLQDIYSTIVSKGVEDRKNEKKEDRNVNQDGTSHDNGGNETKTNNHLQATVTNNLHSTTDNAGVNKHIHSNIIQDINISEMQDIEQTDLDEIVRYIRSMNSDIVQDKTTNIHKEEKEDCIFIGRSESSSVVVENNSIEVTVIEDDNDKGKLSGIKQNVEDIKQDTVNKKDVVQKVADTVIHQSCNNVESKHMNMNAINARDLTIKQEICQQDNKKDMTTKDSSTVQKSIDKKVNNNVVNKVTDIVHSNVDYTVDNNILNNYGFDNNEFKKQTEFTQQDNAKLHVTHNEPSHITQISSERTHENYSGYIELLNDYCEADTSEHIDTSKKVKLDRFADDNPDKQDVNDDKQDVNDDKQDVNDDKQNVCDDKQNVCDDKQNECDDKQNECGVNKCVQHEEMKYEKEVNKYNDEHQSNTVHADKQQPGYNVPHKTQIEQTRALQQKITKEPDTVTKKEDSTNSNLIRDTQPPCKRLHGNDTSTVPLINKPEKPKQKRVKKQKDASTIVDQQKEKKLVKEKIKKILGQTSSTGQMNTPETYKTSKQKRNKKETNNKRKNDKLGIVITEVKDITPKVLNTTSGIKQCTMTSIARDSKTSTVQDNTMGTLQDNKTSSAHQANTKNTNNNAATKKTNNIFNTKNTNNMSNTKNTNNNAAAKTTINISNKQNTNNVVNKQNTNSVSNKQNTNNFPNSHPNTKNNNINTTYRTMTNPFSSTNSSTDIITDFSSYLARSRQKK